MCLFSVNCVYFERDPHILTRTEKAWGYIFALLQKGGEAGTPEATERRQTQVPERRPTSARRPSNSTAAEMMERLAKLEKRIQHCCDSIGKKDGTNQDQVCTVSCKENVHRSGDKHIT